MRSHFGPVEITQAGWRSAGITARNSIGGMGGDYASGERLRRIVDRGVGRLRRKRMHAERPEGPALSGQRPPLLARAMSAQVKFADPGYSVRGADRGSAPITRLSHLPSPAGSRPGSGAEPAALLPSPLHCVDCSPRHLCSQPGRYCGHRHPARSRADSHGAGHRRRTQAAKHSGGRLSQLSGRACYADASSQSPINTERLPPLPDTGPGPGRRPQGRKPAPAHPPQRGQTTKRKLTLDTRRQRAG